MIKRKKKLLIIQTILFLLASLLIYFTYYYNNSGQKPIVKMKSKETTTKTIENNLSKNTFENVEYKGIDLRGNRYVIKSEKAEFDVNNPELIDMKVMTAIFYFKDGSVLTVNGDYGKYNNETYDMEFRNNIVANYQNDIVYADNLDYFNTKNLLTIYGNVRGESIKGNITGDKVKIDLSKKTLDISMFDEKQINVNVMN